jgi:glyoxylase-like metal-dependent hydrolase (beta-lactamase superfamily II)
MPQPLTLDWYEITNPSPGVFAILEPLQIERVLSYLIVGNERALLIDTGTGAVSMKDAVSTLTDLPALLINSHSHWDHVGNNDEFSEITIHRAEAHELAHAYSRADIDRFFGEGNLLGPLPDGRRIDSISIDASVPTMLLDGGESFDLGGRPITKKHTPGHAPGLLSFLDEASGILFSTDTAYLGYLYAYSEDTDLPTYIRSMDLLASLAPSIDVVHPSHNTDTMSPDYLPRMRDALQEVANGREPEGVDEQRTIHQFDGFGVYGRLPEERR